MGPGEAAEFDTKLRPRSEPADGEPVEILSFSAGTENASTSAPSPGRFCAHDGARVVATMYVERCSDPDCAGCPPADGIANSPGRHSRPIGRRVACPTLVTLQPRRVCFGGG